MLKERPQVRVDLLTSGEVPSGFHIEQLKVEDIDAYREVIINGINRMSYLDEYEREEFIETRTAKYYLEALARSEFTLLAAKDHSGKVIGGIEAAVTTIDGQKAGLVRWVCVEPENGGKGVASRLYEEYERILHEGNVHYLMAYVHDANLISLKLHGKAGISQTFMEGKRGKMYCKELGRS